MEVTRFRTKYAGIVLLTLIALTVVPISVNYAQNQDDNFKEIAERAKEKVDQLAALIGETFEPEKSWPEDFIEKEFEEMTTAYGDAEDQNYKDAMKTYREVYRMLNIYAEAEGLTLSEEVGPGLGVGEEAQGMYTAISRARERISRIRDVIASILADDGGADVEAVGEALDAAEAALDEAENLIPNNIPEAALKMEEGNHEISQAFAALKEVAGWLNSWRVESFLQGTKKSTQRTLGLMQGPGINLGKLLEALGYDELAGLSTHIETELDKARDEAKDRNMRGALEHLHEIRNLLRDVNRWLAEQRKGGE